MPQAVVVRVSADDLAGFEASLQGDHGPPGGLEHLGHAWFLRRGIEVQSHVWRQGGRLLKLTVALLANLLEKLGYRQGRRFFSRP